MAKTAFTEADVRRAVSGAMQAGFAVGSVEVCRDGTIRLLPMSDHPKQPDPREEPEPWD